ncbi:endo-1,4-beta-xylanase A precursor [Ruminiclostridium hungatei]|uniref:Beta-xylanase n=1 Tax=Ruminiclostridium hungatei TaxID=48256 RepID=A0A1V4SJK5_RUMHU|nr:endo-1,4-beta-xylanase A precursor [Ruminiclostridium hungatei]
MSSTITGNFRRTISVVLVLCLLISLIPFSSVANAETATVYHETFANGTGIAAQSGGATLTQVTGKAFEGNSDGAALYVSNRANNWDAADFSFSALKLENGKTYTVTVKGYVDTEAEVPAGAQAFLQTVSSYSWLAGADLTAGGAFTLTGTYTVDTAKDDRIRVQSNDTGAAVPFYIGDILITGDKTSGTVIDKEVYHETFSAGKGAAIQSGGATLTQVTGKAFEGNNDGAALYVSNRANNWDAADFSFSALKLENGKTYTVTVKGYVDSDVTVPDGAQAFLQTIGSYSWLAGANFTAGAAFTLKGTYTVDTDKDEKLRIQSNDTGATVPFYIGDILITEQVIDDGNNPPRPPAVPFAPITFEDGTSGGFAGRAGTETLTVTDEENHTTGGALSLKVEGRTSTWHGPSLHVEKYIDQGSEYKITAWVKLIEPASSQLQLSTQVGNGSGASYVSLAAKTISSSDGWVKYEGTYRYNNVADEYLTIYVESSNNATAAFYIDDISFTGTGSGPIEIQDLTPIKDVYQDDFLIGNVVSVEDMQGVRLELLKKHFNAATAGNAMKPDALQRTKGVFTFTDADKLIDKTLAEGLKMHGHTLVWHQQSPAWMNTTEDAGGNTIPLGREEALDNLKTHIKTVVEHFGNKVISWDVVNEAINDNPQTPSDWKASLRQAPWYQAIGADYVEQAFLAAREVLDEHPDWDIRLYYNDYNLDNQNKSKAVYNMVHEINTNYQKNHPGKLLIDGVGMQGHYMVNTNPANVKSSLESFISLGVEVSITELDIQTGSNYQLSEKLAEAQGYLYAQLFKIFREHAANIGRVTIWGLDDGTSWRASTNPLIFDKDLQAKPAYYGVIDPDKYMAEHLPTTPQDARKGTAKYATPVIDGTVDPVWSSASEIPVNQFQMAWQGATGIAKALWDDENLYILVQVSDSQLDKSSANTYEQDSVEVFVDENNGKTSFYQEDDGQYRVNFDNETSFNPAGIAAGFVSATKVSGTNYTVEMKIPFKSISPEEDRVIGFDVQVNDAKDGARQSAAIWNDITGNGYQDTSVYGVLTLVGKNSQAAIIGDLNGDGSIDALDNALMKQVLLGLVTDLPVQDDLYAADLDGDGQITALDLSLIKQYLLGLITKFPKNP